MIYLFAQLHNHILLISWIMNIGLSPSYCVSGGQLLTFRVSKETLEAAVGEVSGSCVVLSCYLDTRPPPEVGLGPRPRHEILIFLQFHSHRAARGGVVVVLVRYCFLVLVCCGCAVEL